MLIITNPTKMSKETIQDKILKLNIIIIVIILISKRETF